MAILGSNLDGADSGSGSSKGTNSISPTANSLVLVSVISFIGASLPNAPTVTGCNVTWDQVLTLPDAASRFRLTVLRSLGTYTPGALTIDFGGQTQDAINYGIDQFTGVDTTGSNGANAIVQSATQLLTGSNTSITITLGAFSDVNNATWGVVGVNSALGITEGSGFTQLDYHAGNQTLQTEWKSTNDTSVDFSWASNADKKNGAAIELKIAPTGTGAAGGYSLFL